MIRIEDTNAPEIANELIRNRMNSGSPVMGMVMTLVIVIPEAQASQAIKDAKAATREHPARLLVLIKGSGRGRSRIDAQIGSGANGWAGEIAQIELTGEVVSHCESIILPLLLPDSPVALWWPVNPPTSPGEDPLGRLGQRRITDAATAVKSQTRLFRTQCRGYAAGNTDLAWSRTTPWRALLAAALDNHPDQIIAGEVSADSTSPSGLLLRAWLNNCLKVPIARKVSAGPGITKVVLKTDGGEIVIDRSTSERMAQYALPGRPPVPVALKRRTVAECLAEELRRFDEDEVYQATVQHVLTMD